MKKGCPDIASLSPTDKEFTKKLLAVAQVDSAVLKRVATMRWKLMNAIKLTQTEAGELLESLKCQGFYHTDLDISGYTFGQLDMEDAVVGGNFNSDFVFVRGDNNQGSMQVRGDNNQRSMQVGWNNNQSSMHIEGGNNQGSMQVRGDNNQGSMQVGRYNYQGSMNVGGYNYQGSMRVGRDN